MMRLYRFVNAEVDFGMMPEAFGAVLLESDYWSWRFERSCRECFVGL